MVVALPIFVAAYAVLVEWWRRALPSSPQKHDVHATRKVSVVIAARNEEANITKILSDLKAQTYPDFEVIVVDDHSDDGTFAMCERIAADFPRLRILKNSSEGKKSAVAVGVKLAEGELVLTTDADCRVQRDWIASVVDDFEEYNADILASPVDMVDVSSASQTLFKRLQRLEFMSLQASTAGGICRNHATMCNSANLAFKRSLHNASAFDGNGRMSRLLTTLLLYRSGFYVGKYISLEAKIAKNKDLYYDALNRAQHGWHEGTEDAVPFMKYLLGTILAAYKDFGDRFAIVEEKLPAIDMVRKAALNKIGRFTKQDIREQCPSLSLSSVEGALRKMVASGELKREGAGKSTCYIRLK